MTAAVIPLHVPRGPTIDYDFARVEVWDVCHRLIIAGRRPAFHLLRSYTRYTTRRLMAIRKDLEEEGLINLKAMTAVDPFGPDDDEGLGEWDLWRVERRKAIVLSRRFGMTRPPRRWWAWKVEVALASVVEPA